MRTGSSLSIIYIFAIKVDEARNSRFILSAESLWFKEYAQALKDTFPQYKIKTRELGYCPVKIASWFDGTIKMILPIWGKNLQLSNARSKEVLKIEYHNAKESITIMATTMIDCGIIADKRSRK